MGNRTICGGNSSARSPSRRAMSRPNFPNCTVALVSDPSEIADCEARTVTSKCCPGGPVLPMRRTAAFPARSAKTSQAGDHPNPAVRFPHSLAISCRAANDPQTTSSTGDFRDLETGHSRRSAVGSNAPSIPPEELPSELPNNRHSQGRGRGHPRASFNPSTIHNGRKPL